MSENSSQEEGPTEKDESQKGQARTLDGNTAPHCEHVFVTGKFCAADASTPVRREHFKNSMHLKCQAEKGEGVYGKREQVRQGAKRRCLRRAYAVRAWPG